MKQSEDPCDESKRTDKRPEKSPWLLQHHHLKQEALRGWKYTSSRAVVLHHSLLIHSGIDCVFIRRASVWRSYWLHQPAFSFTAKASYPADWWFWRMADKQTEKWDLAERTQREHKSFLCGLKCSAIIERRDLKPVWRMCDLNFKVEC